MLTRLYCHGNPSVWLSQAEFYLCHAPAWSEQDEKLHGEKVAQCLRGEISQPAQCGHRQRRDGLRPLPTSPSYFPLGISETNSNVRDAVAVIVSQRWWRLWERAREMGFSKGGGLFLWSSAWFLKFYWF